MNRILKYFLFITIASCISCNQKPLEQTEIRKLLDEYSIALGSKSALSIAQIFHEDAQLLPENGNVVLGRSGIQEHFKGLESIDFEENFEIKEVLSAKDMAIVRTLNTGKWNNLENTESGSFLVKGQMVLKRSSSGDLKIFRYMYNSNPKEEVGESTPIKGSFIHTVYFWLKEPDNEVSREKFVKSLSTFIDNSAFIQSKHLGTPADTNREVIDNSYTYCLVATFNSKEDQDKYQAEAGHLKFIEESKDLWEKIIVYDSENLE